MKENGQKYTKRRIGWGARVYLDVCELSSRLGAHTRADACRGQHGVPIPDFRSSFLRCRHQPASRLLYQSKSEDSDADGHANQHDREKITHFDFFFDFSINRFFVSIFRFSCFDFDFFSTFFFSLTVVFVILYTFRRCIAFCINRY